MKQNRTTDFTKVNNYVTLLNNYWLLSILGEQPGNHEPRSKASTPNDLSRIHSPSCQNNGNESFWAVNPTLERTLPENAFNKKATK